MYTSITALIVLIAAPLLFACEGGDTLVVASYNVENLFDATYDGSEYRAFDPRTDSWGPYRYARSLENTSRVIKDIHSGSGADVLALQEIENPNVLDDLSEELASLGYRYSVLVANSGAFHNAILSRYPVTSVRTHGLSLPHASPGRYILEVDIDWQEHSIRLFVNHWHSKVDGAEETELFRREAAAVLVRRIYETNAEGGRSILVVGDLNESADEYARRGGAYSTALRPEQTIGSYDPRDGLFLTTRPERASIGEDGVLLYSPWMSRLHGQNGNHDGGPNGSYVFRGKWNSLDHILLGPGFDRCASGAASHGLTAGRFEVIAEPYMLNANGEPMRWRSHRASGYSDHLPVQITLLSGEAPDREMIDECHTRRPPSSRFSGDHEGALPSGQVR